MDEQHLLPPPHPHGTPLLRILALLVFALLIAFLSSLVTYWYMSKELQKGPTEIYEASKATTYEVKKPTPILSPKKVNIYTKKDFTFTVPAGWSEKNESDSNSVQITSPDYIAGIISSAKQGARIVISTREAKYPTIEESFNNNWKPLGYVIFEKNLTVDGLPAVQFDVNYEGYQTIVLFQKNNTEFDMRIWYPDPQSKNQYLPALNAVAASFKLNK